MFKNTGLLLIAAACLGLPVEAASVTFNTYPDGPQAVTNGFLLQAQTFTVPVETVLSSFEFEMFSAPGQSAQLEIFAWGSTGPTGSALYTSSVFSRINAVQDFTASGINLSLTQGSLYGAVITNAGYASFDAAFNTNQASYTGGEMWLVSQSTPTVWNNYPSDNLLFQATFVSGVTPPPPSSGVPEPGAFLLVGGGLIGLTLLRAKYSRKSTAHAVLD